MFSHNSKLFCKRKQVENFVSSYFTVMTILNENFGFSKYLARSLVYWRMVELYYLCVDNRNYSTAVHLKGVSPLSNKYSKNARLLPLSPPPSNNVAFHQVGGLTWHAQNKVRHCVIFKQHSSERIEFEYIDFGIDFIL